MVLPKTVNLSFPFNSLQLINYTPANYGYYNTYLPLINADSQLGSEITFIKVNGVNTNTTSGLSGNFFLGSQSGNNIYTGTASTTLSTATSIFFYTYIKLVAIKSSSGTYGWYVVNVN